MNQQSSYCTGENLASVPPLYPYCWIHTFLAYLLGLLVHCHGE